MRTDSRLLPALFVGVLIGTGCSLLVNFDPEGQRCDETGGCLPGYGCVAGKCTAGVDAGRLPCNGCGAGEKCLESTQTCVPNTCQFTRCAVGSICNQDTGTPNCRPVISPALGHPCTDDADCAINGSNRFCLRGAIQNDNPQGSLRTGVCVERCLQFGGGCLTTTAGVACRDFRLGLDAGVTSLCTPENLLFACRTDQDCLDPSFVCTVYDNPQLGPATVCDAVLATGAQPQAVCSTSKADGGTAPYCGNGLCLPQTQSGNAPRCGQLCTTGTCQAPQTCVETEITVRGTPRHVPMCQPDGGSFCKPCADDRACLPDAPRCTPLGFNIVCLSACSQTPGQFPSCPAGQQCRVLDAGVSRCVPNSGSCQ